MKLLRSLSRVAFICNVCFLVTLVIQWVPHPPQGEFISLVIISGYLLAVAANTLVYSWLLILLGRNKFRSEILSPRVVPVWLLIGNFVFWIVQLILILK
jgi:hypothetical protein